MNSTAAWIRLNDSSTLSQSPNRHCGLGCMRTMLLQRARQLQLLLATLTSDRCKCQLPSYATQTLQSASQNDTRTPLLFSHPIDPSLSPVSPHSPSAMCISLAKTNGPHCDTATFLIHRVSAREISRQPMRAPLIVHTANDHAPRATTLTKWQHKTVLTSNRHQQSLLSASFTVFI